MSAVDAILEPYEPIALTVDLPFPVSTNRLWRWARGKKPYKSAEYRRWLASADQHVLVSKILRGAKTICGPFEAAIFLSTDFRSGDPDNRIKAVLDYAQSRSLILDDKLAQKVTVEWVLPNHAPAGCRLVLQELAG